MYKGLYTAHHDCIISLIASTVNKLFSDNSSMYKHSCIAQDWFNSSNDVFCNIPNVACLKRQKAGAGLGGRVSLIWTWPFMKRWPFLQLILAKILVIGSLAVWRRQCLLHPWVSKMYFTSENTWLSVRNTIGVRNYVCNLCALPICECVLRCMCFPLSLC